MIFERLEPRKSCSRVGAVHILLKRVVAEMATKKVQNESPNGSQNEPKIGPQKVLGCYFVILECFLGMLFLLDFWSAKKCLEKKAKNETKGGGRDAQRCRAWRYARWTT